MLARRLFSAASRGRSPWEILGVSPGSTPSQIKKAYFELAKKFHPDTCKEPDAGAKFQQIQQAYDHLSKGPSPEEVANESESNQGSPFSWGGFSRSTGTTGANDGFSSFFGDIFSDFVRQSTATAHVETSIGLTFKEAVLGAVKEIRFAREGVCSPCSGSGIKQGAKKSTCLTCHGTGTIRRRLQGLFFEQTCSSCSGTGYSFQKCSTCSGAGTVNENARVSVKVPAGVQEGDTIKVEGAGNGGKGSLFVRISRVEASKDWERKGNDLWTRVTVPLQTVLLGGKAKVQPIDLESTPIYIDIPSGTQPETTKVIYGKGISNQMTGVRGNLCAKISVSIPSVLTPRQKTLLEAFAQELDAQKGQEKNEGKGNC